MIIVSMIAAAAAPGIALLSYVYLKDRYESEPIHLVARLFVFGMLSVFPVMVVQRGITLWLGTDPFVHSFITAAGVEELAKWLLLAFVMYRHAEFDEPYDGIVYAAAASLGFATMENLLFAFSGSVSWANLLVRALLPVSGHALFGIVMGYYIGRAKFAHQGRGTLILYSILFPIFYHGLYDFFLAASEPQWGWLIIPFMMYLWIRGLQKIRHANHHSPLRMIRREEEFKI